jgi:hypothetical protein
MGRKIPLGIDTSDHILTSERKISKATRSDTTKITRRR